MLKNRSALPRLDYLLTFEIAAELESFAAAAKELNVSETAVSRKIRLLELHYDCALFVRGHRSVQLTDHGRKLLNGITAVKVTRCADRKDGFAKQALCIEAGPVAVAAQDRQAELFGQAFGINVARHQADGDVAVGLPEFAQAWHQPQRRDRVCRRHAHGAALFVAFHVFGHAVDRLERRGDSVEQLAAMVCQLH